MRSITAAVRSANMLFGSRDYDGQDCIDLGKSDRVSAVSNLIY